MPAPLADADLARINDVDELRAMLDDLADRRAAIEARLEELAQAAGNPELRELQSDFYASR